MQTDRKAGYRAHTITDIHSKAGYRAHTIIDTDIQESLLQCRWMASVLTPSQTDRKAGYSADTITDRR